MRSPRCSCLRSETAARRHRNDAAEWEGGRRQGDSEVPSLAEETASGEGQAPTSLRRGKPRVEALGEDDSRPQDEATKDLLGGSYETRDAAWRMRSALDAGERGPSTPRASGLSRRPTGTPASSRARTARPGSRSRRPSALSEYRIMARGVTGSDTLVGQTTAT